MEDVRKLNLNLGQRGTILNAPLDSVGLENLIGSMKFPEGSLPNTDDVVFLTAINNSKSLDEGLTKEVVAAAKLIESDSNENVPFDVDFKSLIGTPHFSAMSTFVESVKKLNRIAFQFQVSVSNFKTAVCTKKMLFSIVNQDMSAEEKLKKIEFALNKLEEAAEQKSSEYTTQLAIMLENYATAVDITKKGEAFRLQNFELLKNDANWASRFSKILATSEQNSIENCLQNARLACLEEKYQLSRLKQLKTNIPDLSSTQNDFDLAKNLKTNYLNLYKEYPSQLEK